MGEKRIRQALVSLLRAKHADSPDMLVRHEMELLGQWNRVDVCTLLDDFHGYEIKSAADNLKRLPRQATAYGRVFDKVTAVVSPSHFDEVTAIVPHWWGITVAVERENHPLTLAEVRESQRNPSLDPFWLAGMLWRTQLDELTRELGLKVKYQARLTKRELRRNLIAGTPLHQLRAAVHTKLKLRMLDQETPTLFVTSKWE